MTDKHRPFGRLQKKLSDIAAMAKCEPVVDKENSKVKLLRAGLEVFSRHGFHGATTKLIANTAGVNESLIMRHFQSKEGLFLAVLAEHKREALANLPYKQSDSLEQEMVQYGRARLELNWQSADFIRMLISQVIADDSMADRVRELMQSEICGPFIDRLRHFQKEGQLHKSFKIDEAARIVEGQIMIHFQFHSLILKTPEKEAQRLLELAMRTLARGFQFDVRSKTQAK